jgi:succinate dehydrogenase / fumarate reductase membrane anchor subunit
MVNRIVVGAHYGLRDWLAQRLTAVIMVIYTVILVTLCVRGQLADFATLKATFAQQWLRVATLLFIASFAWHAWVGVRDILMDYIKPTAVRLGLQTVVVLTIASYVAWSVQILWR